MKIYLRRIRPCNFVSILLLTCGVSWFNTTAKAESDPTIEPPELSAVTSSPMTTTNSSGMQLHLGSGIGVFQDLQVPVDTEAGLRIDGTVPSEGENTTHAGFPIFGGLTFHWPASNLANGLLRYSIATEALQVEASTGNPETRTAGYARLEVKPMAEWSFSLFDQGFFTGASLAVRRSLFKNVSDGHFADTAMSRITLGMEAPGTARLQAFAGFAPVSRFSYDTGKGFQSSTMKGTSTTATEFGVGLNYHIWNTTWFDFSAEQEVISVRLASTDAYSAYGLDTAALRETSRDYNLQTTLIKAGLRRVF